MIDKLIRQELPIQSIQERGDACTATVPVHLQIFSLPKEVRANASLVRDAKRVVSEWYNEDMDYYLKRLKEDDINLPWLRGYEKFSESWVLEGKPDENGFLRLSWKEDGKSHHIQYVSAPVVLYNQHTEFGEFCTPEYCRSRGWIEIIYRNIADPEAVNMHPEKMLKYGIKSDITRFHPEKGIAEVVANAFCSDYHKNMAKTLLLRDFAVFYLNELLSMSQNTAKN